MKLIETERVYCFEITNRQMGTLMRKDRNSREVRSLTGFSISDNLIYRVCLIPGVREVSYDPMYGPAVHVRVESEDPTAMAETLEKTKREIAKYVR